jgi:hypothetical protein
MLNTNTFQQTIFESVISTMSPTKDLDIVLFGATGYTGRLAAEYIVKTFSTSLNWAIAGRSRSGLEFLALNLKEISVDRTQPGKFVNLALAQDRTDQKQKLLS